MLAIGLVLVSLPYKPKKKKQQHLITFTSLCSKIVYIIVSGYGSKISVFTLVNTVIYDYWSPVPLCTYQCKAGEGGGGGGEGRAWGGDLIVFVGPGVGHLTDLVLQGEGIFESFLVRCGDIRLLTWTKESVTEHMSLHRRKMSAHALLKMTRDLFRAMSLALRQKCRLR